MNEDITLLYRTYDFRIDLFTEQTVCKPDDDTKFG